MSILTWFRRELPGARRRRLVTVLLFALILSGSIIAIPHRAESNQSFVGSRVDSNVLPAEHQYNFASALFESQSSRGLGFTSTRLVSHNMVYNGNLTVGPSTSLQIVNTTYTVNGYVFVYGNISLVNSLLVTFPPGQIPQENLFDPHGIWLFDHANATFLNSTTHSPIGTHNSSSILIQNSNITNPVTYTGSQISPPSLNTHGNSVALIVNSVFGWVNTFGRSKLIVKSSRISTIGPSDFSNVSVYNSTVREFSAFDNSVSNVYSTQFGYFVDIELNCTVFLWNSSFPRIGPNGVPSFSIVAIGTAATKGLVGIRLQSKLPLGPGVKDGGATIDITSGSAVSGELRFYWGVFTSADDTFQRLGLQKDGVRIVSWNGSSWQILQDQGSVDFGYTVGGYFWAKFDRAGVYALVSYPVPNFTAWLLFGASFVGLKGLALWYRRKRTARRALEVQRDSHLQFSRNRKMLYTTKT